MTDRWKTVVITCIACLGIAGWFVLQHDIGQWRAHCERIGGVYSYHTCHFVIDSNGNTIKP